MFLQPSLLWTWWYKFSKNEAYQGSQKRGTVHLEMREVKFFYALLDTTALEITIFTACKEFNCFH